MSDPGFVSSLWRCVFLYLPLWIMQESKFLYRLRPKNLLLLFALRKDVYNLLPRSCFPWCYDWHSSNRFSPPEKCNKNEAIPFEVLPSLHIKPTLNNFQAFVLISSRCRIQHVCNFFSWCLRTLQLFLSVLSYLCCLGTSTRGSLWSDLQDR